MAKLKLIEFGCDDCGSFAVCTEPPEWRKYKHPVLIHGLPPVSEPCLFGKCGTFLRYLGDKHTPLSKKKIAYNQKKCVGMCCHGYR